MKARFKYRIYPTRQQRNRLAKLFGCVRVVWNDSLACCQEKYTLREKKNTNYELQKLFITQAKKTEYRKWLSEVSIVPLQQLLNDLNRRGEWSFAPTKTFSVRQKAREKVKLLNHQNLKAGNQNKLLGLL